MVRPQSFPIPPNPLKFKDISFSSPPSNHRASPAKASSDYPFAMTKRCPIRLSLSDRNEKIRRFSTDRKLIDAFLCLQFLAQTIAECIQTFYRDTLSPLIIRNARINRFVNSGLKTRQKTARDGDIGDIGDIQRTDATTRPPRSGVSDEIEKKKVRHDRRAVRRRDRSP
jgi:hypothetical protein